MKNIYKYDIRFLDNLTETKDLKKSIKINLIIMISFFILFIGGFICGVIFLPREDKIYFMAAMSVIGIMESFLYVFSIKAILRAVKKIKENESLKSDE